MPRKAPPGPVLVASYADAQRMRPRPVIHLNHGAGQRYEGDPASAGHGAFAGGAGLEHVVLFLDPSERCAEAWRAMYPATPAVAVGCPALDRHHDALERDAAAFESRQGPLVAVTFHHSHAQIPEQASALAHFQAALGPLRDAVRAAGGDLLGHGHPRAQRPLQRLWWDLGVEFEPDWDRVLTRMPDLLVVDNSSAAPEMASVGVPICWLWPPWYRRSAQHGGRFGGWVGDQVEVQDPAGLVAGVFRALGDPPEARVSREAMVRDVYVACDGSAAERAVAAILAL